MSNPLKIGVLISGRGSNLQALIDACADPDFPATIAIVITNKADAQGLARAEKAGIPTTIITHTDYDSRESFDDALTTALANAGVELVCLAGFMRLLTPSFVTYWHDRLINIHPSLLPSFKGLHTHEAALKAGVKISGCTVHFVRHEMDVGPIIMQAAVPVLDTDTPDTLASRILEQEHRCYPQAVRLIAEGRVAVRDERVTIAETSEIGTALLSPSTQ